MRFAIALLVTLSFQPAWAQQDEDQQRSGRGPAAAQSGEDIPGYGYGTQNGQEANGGARQSTRKAAKRSTAPQDERGAAATRAAEQEGSAAASRSASASGSPSGKRAHARPARSGHSRKKATGHTHAREPTDAASAPAVEAPAPQR